jgi:hypothetical protein
MADYKELLKLERNNLRLALYLSIQLIEEVGKERALEIIEKAWAQYGINNWKTRLEGIPPDEVLRTMALWFKAQAEFRSELRVVEATQKCLRIEFTRCLTYDVCKEMGVPEVCQKYCDSDYKVIPLMYPKIKLVRDKELAYGDDCCNHCWVIDE